MSQSTLTSKRGRRYASSLVLTMTCLGILPAVPAPAAPSGTQDFFKEVGTVPLQPGSAPKRDGVIHKSGWLILDPTSRWGYQVFEVNGGPSSTIIQSFNLDTLAFGRSVVVEGAPVTSGTAGVTPPESTDAVGDIVHAVDEEAGILYIALSDQGSPAAVPEMLVAGVGPAPDGQRPWGRILAIDEEKFHRGAADYAASFREPADQVRLHSYWIMGMKVHRHGVPRSGDGQEKPGKLVVLFAQPSLLTGVVPVYDHTLVQWDPTNLNWDEQAPGASDPTRPQLSRELVDDPVSTVAPSLPVAGDWARRLDPCIQAPLATTGSISNGNYQWGILVTARAVFTACQQRHSGGAVVKVELDEQGRPKAVGGQLLFPLGNTAISDVLVDDFGERLLVRSWGGGNTLWVFDARSGRFTGSIAAKLSDGYSIALGMNPRTGRLYSLLPDHAALDRGRDIPVRGGLHYSDSRLDPAPPLTNAAPSLEAPGWWKIAVDPVTRHVFVRRGDIATTACVKYPGTQSANYCPAEPYWRVLKDMVPETERPKSGDDSIFTTDVEENPALTKASYLGSGSGFGTRTLLIGGVTAATGVPAGPCSLDNRELLAGSVDSVGVSDFAVTANAASLDADARTREVLGTPGKRCIDPSLPRDTGEFAFDESKEPEKDCAGQPAGCTVTEGGERTGTNGYAASCVGTDEDSPGEVQRKVSRKEFTAEVTCDEVAQKASGEATGSFFVPEANAAQRHVTGLGLPVGVPGDTLRVAYSSSTVSIDRDAGEGVTVTVDSIARGIEIPGVGRIGVVRTESTSTAAGRRGTAKASFRRSICGVVLPDSTRPDCLSDEQQTAFVKQLNEALLGQGEARLRSPDEALLKGSISGYQAGVQRDRRDGFGDRTLAKDFSLAVPGLEIVFYRNGGRQIVQLAGSQAGTSYGIACLFGQTSDGGRCARDGEAVGTPTLGGSSEGGDVVTVVQEVPGQTVTRTKPESRLVRLLKAIPRAIAEALRLLFNSPRELGLMAAVWSLLYAPCYLGERRRNIRALRARRIALGGVA